MSEIKRVLLNPKRLLLLLGLILLSVYWLTPPAYWQTARDYKAAQEDLLNQYKQMPIADVMTELDLLTDNGSYLTGQYSALYDKISYLDGFEKSLQNIQKKASSMSTVSIFAGSPYSQANIKKTAADYTRLESITPTLGLDRPIEEVVQNDRSDYLLGLWMLVLVYSFLAERRRGLWNVVCASPKGRLALPLWRLYTIGLGAILGAVSITLGELTLSYSLHGGIGELGRMIQSVPMFFGLTIPMTVGEFWIMYLGLRILGAFVIGLVAWLIFELISDRRIALAVLAAVLGLEYVLTNLAGGTGFLRVVNIFSFIQPRKLLLDYENIKVFDTPTGKVPLVLLSGIVIAVLSSTIVLFRYARRRPTDGYAWLDRLGQFFTRLTAPLGFHTGLLGHSLHQILSVGKGALILLVALAVGFTLAEPPQLGSAQTEEVLYESYLRQSQGPFTEDNWTFLQKQEDNLARDKAAYEALLQDLESGAIDRDTFEQKAYYYKELYAVEIAVGQYREYLNGLSAIDNAHVLPHWVYEGLMGDTAQGPVILQSLCLVTCLLLFIFQAGAQSRSGMGKSQESTLHGRLRLKLTQHLAAWIVTFVFCALIWAFQLSRLWGSYGSGLPFPNAPANCLSFLKNVSARYTVLGYWVVQVLKQTLMTCCWSSIILLLTGGLQRKR